MLCQAMIVFVTEQINYGANNGGTRASYGPSPALTTRASAFAVRGGTSGIGTRGSPFLKTVTG